MKRSQLLQGWKLIKLAIICSVSLYIAVFLVENPISDTVNQPYDIYSAILISLGFAASFRTLLYCRKKV